ncbi:MAG: flippase, partial [Candidatus Aenigmatarchaeota archaeon]
EKFGLIAFAQAFIQYLVILTDYGFNLSATREISIYRDNKEKVSEIFSSVMIIKFGLLVLSFIIMSVIVFSFEKFKKDWLIYYLTFGIVIGQTLFPVWFFQGMERMRYIVAIETSIKSIFLLLVFLFIHNTNDFWKVPLINTIGMIIGGIISLLIVIKYFHIRYYLPKLKISFQYLKTSTSLFLSQVSVSLFNQTNTFIGGLIFNYTLLGYYKAAEKLFIAFRNIFGIVFRTLYPFFSRKRGNFVSLYNWITVAISILMSVLLFLSADSLVNLLYGEGFQLAINVLKIFSIAIFFSGINIMIFTLWFLSNGFYEVFFWITIFAGLFNVMSLFVLSKIIGILGIPLSAVATEIVLLLSYFLLKRRLKVINGQKKSEEKRFFLKRG